MCKIGIDSEKVQESSESNIKWIYVCNLYYFLSKCDLSSIMFNFWKEVF